MNRGHPDPSHPELPLRDHPRAASDPDPEPSGADSGESPRPPNVFEFDNGGSGAEEKSAARGSDPEVPSQVKASDELFERAKADWKAGHENDALRKYRELVAMDPGHVRARNNLGVLLDQSGAHEVALEQFQAALEIEPENPEVLANYGAALAALGRYDQAESQLRRAMRIEPGRVGARANLGILYFRKGLYAQSENELRWVCEQDPEHGTAHFYRGEALNRLGRVDDALEILERASHLQPDRARIYYLLGILYDRKHLRQEAGAMYRKARELSDR